MFHHPYATDFQQLLFFDTTRTAKKMTPPTILPCSENVFTEPLPSNDTDDTQTQTVGWVADVIAAGAMTYISGLIKIGSGVQS
jgi:hypothetical protein